MAKKIVNVYASSKVDPPNNLFDKFGRALCDVIVSQDITNINQWLVAKGWAFPDFYNSMSETEINVLRDKGTTASNTSAEVRDICCKQLVKPFNFSLIFDRDSSTNDNEQDKGKLNLPKFFRKQVNYEILKKSGVTSIKTLKDYIEFANTKCYRTSKVLKSSNFPKIYQLSDFINEDGYMDFNAGDLIHVESESQIVNNAETILNEWY
jgi:hypothetical protein